jgi:hypothetical protein
MKELAVLRRSAVVNQLYGGSKLAVEVEDLGEGISVPKNN